MIINEPSIMKYDDNVRMSVSLAQFVNRLNFILDVAIFDFSDYTY